MATGLSGLLVTVAAGVVLGAPVAGVEVNEQTVREAIEKAVAHLYSAANEKGIWDAPKAPDFRALVKEGVRGSEELMNSQWPGRTALVLNALAAAGQQHDPRFKKAVAWLMKQDMAGPYGLGMRMELIHRLRDSQRYRSVLRKDVRMLAKGLRKGKEGVMWQYLPPPATTFYSCIGDFSNTNYGVLGLWAASDERVEIPARVWSSLEKTYLSGQLPDGSWAYYHGMLPQARAKGTGGASASMTTAGIASLYLILDRLHVRRGELGGFRRTASYKAIRRAMKWMQTHFSATTNPGWGEFTTYYFYNCERVAHAAGLKYFGAHDWFREIAATLLRAQRADGSIRYKTPARYGGVPVDTSFALLFLAKGSAPVIFNKLRHGGDWDNHLRELAALTEWLARQRERPANWQVVNLKVTAEELTDSRILYVAGRQALRFPDEQKAKLKRFVELGGMLVFHPDLGSRGFAHSARRLLADLWPRLETRPVDLQTHPLGRIYKPLSDRRIRIEALASPVRVLALIVHGDPAAAWARRDYRSGAQMFELGAALHYFANDRASLKDMPTKLTYFAEPLRQPAAKTTRQIRLARIRYGDNPHRWDPEPLAFERFARRLAAERGVGCEIRVVQAGELPASGAKIAHLTGVDDPKLTGEQVKAIGRWLQGGGVLIVDRAGGARGDATEPFDAAFRKMVAELYGPAALRPLPTVHPLRKGIEQVTYRHVAGLPRRRMEPTLEHVQDGDRQVIVYSRHDLTCGLLGCPNPLVSGANEQGAQQILSHLLLKLGDPAAAPAAP
jgi:hypothetical protein